MESKKYPELWKLYPEIWPTKARFFQYLRGQLRRALWERYPVKLRKKTRDCTAPPKGYTGRAKSGTTCALTGDWYAKSHLEVDHVVGNASLSDWSDLEDFILHLLTTEDNMQLVCKEAHKIKSYADRHGISFEEAKVEKTIIEKCKKKVAEQKKELLASGFKEEDISNATKRREAYGKLLRGEVDA